MSEPAVPPIPFTAAQVRVQRGPVEAGTVKLLLGASAAFPNALLTMTPEEADTLCRMLYTAAQDVRARTEALHAHQ